MIEWMILSPTRDRRGSWCTVGSSRDEVEARWLEAIATGHFEKPLYRVIAHRRAA